MSRRATIIGAVVLAAAAAIVLAIALGGGDEERAEQAPHGPPTTGVTERTTPRTERTETETVEDLTDTAPRRDARRAEVEQAVFELAAAVETGRPPAGLDVSALPTSDELSVERTRISGDRATVTLAGGVTVRLRRSGGEWTPVSVQRGG